MENELIDIINKISEAQVSEDVEEQIRWFNKLREIAKGADYSKLLDHTSSWMSFITLNTPPRLKLVILDFVIELLKLPEISITSKAAIAPSVIATVNFFLPQITQPQLVYVKFVQLFTLLHPLGLVYIAEHALDESFSESWLGCRQAILNYMAPLLTDSSQSLRRHEEQRIMFVVIRCLAVIFCAETERLPIRSKTDDNESETDAEINLNMLSKTHPMRLKLKELTEIILGALLTVIITPSLSLACRTAGLNASFFVLRKRPYLFPKFFPIYKKAYSMVLGTLQAKSIFYTLRAGLFSFSKWSGGSEYSSVINELLFKIDRNLSAWREEVARQAKQDKNAASAIDDVDDMETAESPVSKKRPLSASETPKPSEKKRKTEASEQRPVVLPSLPPPEGDAVSAMSDAMLSNLATTDKNLFCVLNIPRLPFTEVCNIIVQFLFSPQGQLLPPKDLATVLPALMPTMMPLLVASYGNGPFINDLTPLLSSGFSIEQLQQLLPHLQLATRSGSLLAPLLMDFKSGKLVIGSPNLPTQAKVESPVDGISDEQNTDRDLEPAIDESDEGDTAEQSFADLHSFLAGEDEFEPDDILEARQDLFRRLQEQAVAVFGRGLYKCDYIIRDIFTSQGNGTVLCAHETWCLLISRLAASVTAKSCSGDNVLLQEFLAWTEQSNPPQIEACLFLLFELYFLQLKEKARHVRLQTCKQHSRVILDKYFEILKSTVSVILAKFAEKPKILAKFLIEVPLLKWDVIDTLLTTDIVEKPAVIMVTLQELILKCDAVSAKSLETILAYAIDENTKYRHPAILMVKKLADHFEPEIELFSRKQLRDLGSTEFSSDEFNPNLVKKHLDLYFALCHRRVLFMVYLFESAAQWSDEVIAVIKAQLAGLLRSIGEDSQLTQLLREPSTVLQSERAEELLVRIVNLLIQQNDGHASATLIDCICALYVDRKINLNLLSVLVPDMEQSQIDQYMGDLVGLVDSEDGKLILRQLFAKLCADDNRMTPERIFIRLHELAGTPQEPSAPALLKQCVAAINECFALPGLFTSTVILKALTELVTDGHVSVLFARTLLQFVKQNSSMAVSVQFLLRKLIDFKAWKFPALWSGFVLLIRHTLPYSVSLLSMHLEVAQVKMIIAKLPDVGPLIMKDLEKLPPSSKQSQRYKDLIRLLSL